MSLETELMDEVESFTKKAVYKIGEAVKNSFNEKLHTEVTSETEIEVFGDYGYKFRLLQEMDGAKIDADVTIHFTFVGASKSDYGFYVEILGFCSDGTNVVNDDWKESPLRAKGDFKDFIDVVENYHPVEYCEKIINKFCENIRQSLIDSEVA